MAVPSLVELAYAATARELDHVQLSKTAVRDLPQHVRSAVLRHAVEADTLSDSVLVHFATSSALDLHASRVSDRGLCLVGQACGSRLLRLDLSHCTRLRDTGVIALTHQCPQLQHLNVSHCRFTDVAIECASRSCPELRELVCSWNGSGVGDRSARAIAKHSRRLELVALCGSRIGDEALLALAAACPQLRSLGTRGCELLTESGLTTALCSLPHIHTLELAQLPRLSEPSLQLVLSRMSGVLRLDLSMCSRLGDTAVCRAASSCLQLRTLECYGMARLRAHIASQSITLACSPAAALSTSRSSSARSSGPELQNCRQITVGAIAALGEAAATHPSRPRRLRPAPLPRPLLHHAALARARRLREIRSLGSRASLRTWSLRVRRARRRRSRRR